MPKKKLPLSDDINGRHCFRRATVAAAFQAEAAGVPWDEICVDLEQELREFQPLAWPEWHLVLKDHRHAD